MMSYENLENVKAEVRDGILYVTIDRPKVLNACLVLGKRRREMCDQSTA